MDLPDDPLSRISRAEHVRGEDRKYCTRRTAGLRGVLRSRIGHAERAPEEGRRYSLPLVDYGELVSDEVKSGAHQAHMTLVKANPCSTWEASVVD